MERSANPGACVAPSKEHSALEAELLGDNLQLEGVSGCPAGFGVCECERCGAGTDDRILEVLIATRADDSACVRRWAVLRLCLLKD